MNCNFLLLSSTSESRRQCTGEEFVLRENVLTIDVEDYFQVSAFESVINRDDWKNFESRVERNTDKILEILNEHQVKATFFVLGWVAAEFPKLVQRIEYVVLQCVAGFLHGFQDQLNHLHALITVRVQHQVIG